MRGGVVKLLVFCCVSLCRTAEIHLPPRTPYPTDMKNTSIQTIIEGLGMLYESYDVTTQDGYILNLNRMVNPKKVKARDKGVPVLFVHGMQMYSETWFLQSTPQYNVPVAYLLRGYDVWLGDQRGTVRSTRHVNMTADTYDFWNFSFHETGVYDLPAFIDFILNETGHKKLVYSGLSLGATFYYVLCSEKPKYQGKLYGAMLFQPLGAAPKISEMKLGAQMSMKFFDVQMHLHQTMKIGQSLPNIQRQKVFTYFLCQVQPFAVMSSLTGFSTGEGCQFDGMNFCAQIATSLGGASARTVIHAFQLFKNGGKFTKYDWGVEENLKRYGITRPPEYDVRKIRTFTAAYVSDTDEYTPTRKVVPFVRKFSGPTYICKYPDVCHMFTEYDSRAGPYVEDSADVLDSITGRNKTKMHSGTCNVEHKPAPKDRNFISKTKDIIYKLLPSFIAQRLQ